MNRRTDFRMKLTTSVDKVVETSICQPRRSGASQKELHDIRRKLQALTPAKQTDHCANACLMIKPTLC